MEVEKVKLDRIVLKIGTCLATVQGLAWFGLSLAGVIVYYADDPVFDQDSYFDVLNSNFYYFYLYGNDQVYPNQTLNGRIFNALLMVMLLHAIPWVAVSVYLFFQKVPSVKRLHQWSYITIIVSGWDLVGVLMFVADYDRCLSYVHDLYPEDTQLRIQGETLCANMVLIPLVITARGFILWILNVVFGVLVLIIARNAAKAEPSDTTKKGFFAKYYLL